LIYLFSTTVFSAVIVILVGLLLLVESRLTVKGDRKIVINDDKEKEIITPGNKTLLAALLDNQVLIPCACGGKGTCGTCKCVVKDGGGDILPTELSLVSRRERKENVRLACQVNVMIVRSAEVLSSGTKVNVCFYGLVEMSPVHCFHVA